MRLCIYARNTGTPCEGTAYSRKIVCEAGEPNTCLRNCNSRCPFYVPLDPDVIARKSAEILKIRHETRERIETERQKTPAPRRAPVGVDTVTETRPGGCGCGCGGGSAPGHVASSGGAYIR